MQFMMLICDDEKARDALPEEQRNASYAKVGQWWGELEAKGLVVPDRGNRLQKTSTAKTVRVDNGRSVVTDGPFAETKEAIGGFGLVNAPDIDAAVEVIKTWPGLPITIELRPVLEG